jgi:adenosylmethionine-8-amino-7-oxononanoate aminotransferase
MFYMQTVADFMVKLAACQQTYEANVLAAREAHKAAVAIAKQQWQQQQEQMQQAFSEMVQASQQKHDEAVQQVRLDGCH